jgi:hypothetical protein
MSSSVVLSTTWCVFVCVRACVCVYTHTKASNVSTHHREGEKQSVMNPVMRRLVLHTDTHLHMHIYILYIHIIYTHTHTGIP